MTLWFAFFLLLFYLTLTRAHAFGGERKINARSLMQHMYRHFGGIRYFWKVTLSCSGLLFLLFLRFYLCRLPITSGFWGPHCLEAQVQQLSFSLPPFYNSKLSFPFPQMGMGRGSEHGTVSTSQHKLRSSWEIRYQSFLLDILDPFLLDINSWQQHCPPTLSHCSRLTWLPHSPWNKIGPCGAKRNWER